MRIIAGSNARTRLIGPRDLATRPITDRVKESLFSILMPIIDGAFVADLFCGTGSLGLESISRGAARAILIDKDPDALKRLRKNIEKLRFEDRTTVIPADVFKYGIVRRGKIDTTSPEAQMCNLVFVDPPYLLSRDTTEQSRLGKLLIKLGRQVADDATIVVRHERRTKLLESYGDILITDQRSYGSMTLTFYQKRNAL